MDFLVERPPKEVLDRAEAYMSRRRFHVHLTERTETTAMFTQIHIQRKGLLRTLLNSLAAAHIPRQEMRLLASEAGEGRTRLTVIGLKQGKRTDEWPDIKDALEQWVVEELGGIVWPLWVSEKTTLLGKSWIEATVHSLT